MRPLIRFLSCLPLLCLGEAALADSTPWPEIPPPPKASVQWVGQRMRIDGVPTRILRFDSQARDTEVVEYYRAYWSNGFETKPSVKTVEGYTVVGQAFGPFFMTVRVRDAQVGAKQVGANPARAAQVRGSDGTVTVARLLGSRRGHDPGDVPVLPGAEVLQVIESIDGDRYSRQVSMNTSDSVQRIADAYRARLAGQRWQLAQAIAPPKQSGAPSGLFLTYVKGQAELQLSVAAAPGGRGAHVQAIHVTKDTGSHDF